jgi:hypothetical protein
VCDKIASEAVSNACMGYERVDERVERLRHKGTLSASDSESRVETEQAEKRPSLVLPLHLAMLLYCPRGQLSHRFHHGLNPRVLPKPAWFL